MTCLSIVSMVSVDCYRRYFVDQFVNDYVLVEGMDTFGDFQLIWSTRGIQCVDAEGRTVVVPEQTVYVCFPERVPTDYFLDSLRDAAKSSVELFQEGTSSTLNDLPEERESA